MIVDLFIMKLFLIVLVFLCSSMSAIQAQTAADTYMNYCSGCHGQKLEGGRAPSLLITPWKHGESKKAVIQNISKGIPGTEMMGWAAMLSPKEIEQLTDYILSLRKRRSKS